MKRISPFLVGILLLVPAMLASPAAAETIDFESLGLPEGAPVPTIDGVTFEASVAIQGGSGFAFFAQVDDTGTSPPFSVSGTSSSRIPGDLELLRPSRPFGPGFPTPSETSVSASATSMPAIQRRTWRG